jgi:hypothetical protein
MSLVQQSGDLELINILQGTSNNMYNSQNLFNITVLIPQQTSIQPLATGPELSMVNRKRIFIDFYNSCNFNRVDFIEKQSQCWREKSFVLIKIDVSLVVMIILHKDTLLSMQFEQRL